MGWPRFHELARRSGGVVRLSATAGAARLSRDTVRRRARQEEWWWPFPDVVAVPGTVIDPRARAHAAVLHARGRAEGFRDDAFAAATRWTAAYLLGVNRQAPTRPQITIPASRALRAADHKARRDGFALDVVRSSALGREDLTVARNVPTVNAARLVRDLSPVCTRDRLRAMVIDMVHRKQLTLHELTACLQASRSFPGRPMVRQVLVDLGAAGRTDSPLELQVRHRFADAGIPLDRGQVPVRLNDGVVIHWDLGILAIRFGIEVDSMGHHSSREDLFADAQRANEVAVLPDPWRIMRVTWDLMLPGRWERLVAAVREAITQQSRVFLGVDWPRDEDIRR